ncbi:Pkinase-domain-containing protein [Ramaria rubella]|nr:Pkinase-domain-containing protein [Ramaria rubella]
MATNDMNLLNPPRGTKPTYRMYHPTRWEKEKAAAGSPDAFEYPDDPKLIGPWIIGETVGKGASGRVKIARHKLTGKLAAVKILPAGIVARSRNSLAKAEKHRMGIEREIVMMKLMEHPNIMRLYDVWEGDRELFLILEWIEGGELFDLIVNRGRLPPLEALAYFKQIIHGLSYCHAFSIAHRDLKPENILIHGSKNELVKIADWGMAAFQSPHAQLETSCGSPHYASPEIIRGERYEGAKADIWSVGVVLFALMAGKLPFDDKHVPHLLSKVKSGKFEMPAYVYPEAADLIQRMLVVDVQKRISMSEILSHSFFSRDTPGIYHIAAPSVSALQAPLLCAEDIDQDVLSSLRIIFGKHSSRMVILNELLQEAPNCAKAFYALLLKFRDRQMENFNGDRDDIDGKGGPHPYQSPRIQPVDAPMIQAAISPVSQEPIRATTRPTHARTQSSPTKHHSAPVGMRPRPPTVSGARPPRLPLPLMPVPSYATATSASKTKESALLGLKGPAAPTLSVPATPAPSYQTIAPPRPSNRRRDTTPVPRNVGLGVNSQASTGHTSTSARSNVRRRDTSPGEPRSSLGLGITAPSLASSPASSSVPSPAQTPSLDAVSQKLYPTRRSSDITVSIPAARARRATSPAPPPFITPTTRVQPDTTSFVPLKSPRMLDPEAQSAMDHLVSQANVLGALDNAAHIARDSAMHQVLQSPAILQEVQKPSRLGTGDGHAHGQADRLSIRSTGEKENEQLRTPQRGRAGSEGAKRAPGLSKAPILGRSRNVPERSGSLSVTEEEKVNDTVKGGRGGNEATSKKSMIRKTRPVALDLDPITPAFSPRPTFNITSPTSTPATPLFSPVVGEFRGWFSNLFNWKTPTYILHSHNPCLTTRDEAARLLADLGVSVVLEDVQGWGVLKCKVDDMTDVNGVITQKQVRFRVEFQPYRAAPPASPAADSSVRTFALGPQSGVVFACTLTLVQEKGALSTFRAVYQKLRMEWRLDALQSPVAGSMFSGGRPGPAMEVENGMMLVR